MLGTSKKGQPRMMIRKSILVGILFHISIFAFGQNTILWSVQDSSSNKTSYLLGTFHQMGNSFIDSIPQIKSALSSSELAIFETTSAGKKVSELMQNRKDQYEYKNVLKNSDLIYLDEISSDWTVPLSKVNPIELLIKLQQTATETLCGTVKPTDKWNHFDQYLIHLATEDSIPLYGLETDSLQIELINRLSKSEMTWNDAEKPIHKTLMDIKKHKHSKRYCQAAWNYINMQFDYQFTETCNTELKSRNENWIPQLEKILPEKNCFIAVGLLHLYGECGLIVQLRKRGYKVEPVELKVQK